LPAYGQIPGNGPTVVLMAFDINQTLYGGSLGTITTDLITAGFSLLALDLPCHGSDATEPAGSELTCWRRRLESGDQQLFTRYCAGLSAVLDHLRVQQAYVVGQSRGAYVAATCTALDSRLTRLVLLKPVTDLTRLVEFTGFDPGPEFLLSRLAPQLAGLPIMLRIGTQDTRVGTDAAVSFAQLIGANLRLSDTPGHDLPEDGSTVQWLRN
jgi:pimeloyl-ACP methyl ester carboxylesterase